MNIKETLEKYGNIALTCQSFDDIKLLIDQLKNEEIRHTYYLYQEDWKDMFVKYTSHLDSKFRSVVMIVEEKTGYNIYTRSYKDYDKYHDWHRYHFIDYSLFIHGNKLDKLI